MSNIFVRQRLYQFILLGIALFVVSSFISFIFFIAIGFIILLSLLTVYELYLVNTLKSGIKVQREVVKRLSLGDDQQIIYKISNSNAQEIFLMLFDELPIQFQHRSSIAQLKLKAHDDIIIKVDINPRQRGQYRFGNILCYLSHPLIGLVEIRKIIFAEEQIKVVPSILQMKKYSIYTLKKASHLVGLKKIRTIGENDEFELIKDYQQGDNIKSINWKATSRTNTLMVNQYQDTRSQEVICIIDKGRTMEMPFNGLSLLDYAINSALVISNIVLQKSDKIGLITFSKNVDTFLKADSRNNQLQQILENLYAEKPLFLEHNYELLYALTKRKINRRSIIFLYSNIEHKSDLQRIMPYIEMINKNHILIFINFINTELYHRIEEQITDSVEEVYYTAMAQKIYFERFDIEILLKSRGIQYIYTKPEDLNINVINKYLEIKAKRIK